MPMCAYTYIHMCISNCLCEHLCAYVIKCVCLCARVCVCVSVSMSVCTYLQCYSLRNLLTAPPAISRFKEVIVVMLTCDTYCYHSNEFKSRAGVSEWWTLITLHLTDPSVVSCGQNTSSPPFLYGDVMRSGRKGCLQTLSPRPMTSPYKNGGRKWSGHTRLTSVTSQGTYRRLGKSVRPV